MSQAAEFEQVNIVLLGSFNPAIFQPAWFAAHGLIRCDKDKVPLGVKAAISHPEISAAQEAHRPSVRNRSQRGRAHGVRARPGGPDQA